MNIHSKSMTLAGSEFRIATNHACGMRSTRSRTVQSRLVVRIYVLLVAMAAGHVHAENDLGTIGGGGGGAFRARCAAPAFLTGIEVHSGDYVDALRPLCFDVLGSGETSAGDWQGGSGGGVRRMRCPDTAPIVRGIYVGIDHSEGVVNDLLLYCTDVTGASESVSARLKPGEAYATHDDTQGCGNGLFAVGMHGRSGKYIDAVGLICDAQPGSTRFSTTITGLGRTKSTAPAKTMPAGSVICDRARDARARNSPAAPNLEAQCRANIPPVSSIGRTKAPSAPSPPPASTPPATPSPLPAPAPPTKQQTRDAALQALIGTVVSTIQQSRDNTARNHQDGNARTRDDDSGPRRRGPLPREAHGTTGVEQAGSAYAFAQPDRSIRVQVRYPQAYGYKDAAGLFDPGPNSCGAFYISAFPTADARPRDPTRIDTHPSMRTSNGMYVCEYLIHDQPTGTPVMVRVAMSDQRAAGSEAWLGGDQAQPLPGQRRTIVDGTRQLVLTADRPSASLSFEMVYAGSR